MDVRITCPICGQAEVESLPDHLKSHSKQSLIDILLAQQQQLIRHCGSSQTSIRAIPRASNTHDSCGNNAHPGDTNPLGVGVGGSGGGQIMFGLGGTSSTPTVREGITSFLDTNTNPRAIQNKKSGGGQSSGLRIEFGPHDAINVKPSTSKARGNKFHSHSVPASAEVFNPPKNAVTSGHPSYIMMEHNNSSGATITPGPSKTRSTEEIHGIKHLKHGGNAEISSNTSIIQYIIDESGQITDAPQEEPDSWILADGRTIPVYSSLHEVPAISGSGSAPPCALPDNPSKVEPAHIPAPVERSQMHLDLMTDEEIPPRGEISEYEETESNASSILSEDSNLRQGRGMFSDSRRSPATVLHEQNLFLGRKKRNPPKPLVPTLSQQYTCHECTQPQLFNNPFELAEHKFESHQSKSVASTTTVSAPPSSTDNFCIKEQQHILPEKIRRQSQTDEILVDPLGDLSAPTELVTVKSATQSSPKEYFCVYCDFTTKRRATLSEHMEFIHAGKPRVPNMFECTYCGKIFNARTNLRKHLLVHKERKYSCPSCPKGFTSNFKLMEHIRVHTKTYPFKCNSCEKTYRTPSLLNYHTKMVHLPESERPEKRKLEFYCSTCHRVLHSKRSYTNHMRLHQEKPIKCTSCCETFTRHSVLVRHIRIAHNPQFESKESKDCPVCHKKLHPNSMIKHMRIHSNEKPFSCNVCSKEFRTHANLTSHSWSHTNQEKPHKCTLCSKSYLFKRSLENHMMVHKKRTMHFVCNECGVKFSHKVNMKRHLEEHFKEKKHVCKTCGKAFQRHYYLIEHERIHSGLKPFVCNICGKSSTTKSNHRAHLKIHDARETGNQEG